MNWKLIWFNLCEFFRRPETNKHMVTKLMSYTNDIVAINFTRSYMNDTDLVIGKLTYDKKLNYFYVDYPYSIFKHYTIAAQIGLTPKWDKIIKVYEPTETERIVWRNNMDKFIEDLKWRL